jgi:hypothetical protein
VGGKRPRDLAERTELKIFSPTFDKSIPPLSPPPPPPPPPPCNNKKGTKKNNLELSNPKRTPSSPKSAFNKNGFPNTLPNGNRFGCILTPNSEIYPYYYDNNNSTHLN